MNKKLLICHLLFISLAFASCIKKEVTPLKDEGSTFVKLLGGGSPAAVKSVFIDFVNTTQKILAIDIRRDCANNAELQSTHVVVIKDDEAAVTAANPAYVLFPASWYTIESEAPKVGGAGGTFTFTFKPGEFAKQIYLVIPNATLLNPSITYGLGFTIQSIDRGGKISYSKSQVVTIGAKNNYDGVYEDDFTNYHPTANPGYTGDIVEVDMVTTGANKVKIYFPLFGGYYCPAVLNGGLSAFGAQEPEYTINTTTNAVTVQNAFPGAVTFYEMAAGYTSYYDPGIRTIFCKWGYNYSPGAIFNAATSREWTQKLKYLRSR